MSEDNRNILESADGRTAMTEAAQYAALSRDRLEDGDLETVDGSQPELSVAQVAELGRYVRVAESAGQANELLRAYGDVTSDQLAETVLKSAAESGPEVIAAAGEFNFRQGMEALLHHGLGEPANLLELSPEYQKARKQLVVSVCSRLGDELSRVGSESELEALQLTARNTEQLMFSGSPNMVNYVGGLDDMVDVVLATQSVPLLRWAGWEAQENLMQAMTFASRPDSIRVHFNQTYDRLDDVGRLGFLKLIDQLGQQAADASYGDTAGKTCLDVLSDVSGRGSALSSLMAETYRDDLVRRYKDGEWDDAGDAVTQTYWTNQYGYQGKYTLPVRMSQHYQAMPLACDAVGIQDPWGVVRFAEPKAEVAPVEPDAVILSRAADLAAQVGEDSANIKVIANWAHEALNSQELAAHLGGVHTQAELVARSQAGLRSLYGEPQALEPVELGTLLRQVGQSEASVPHATRLLQEMHRPRVREAVEQHLGVNLGQLSLRGQVYLTDYLASADRDSFDQLGRVLQEKPELGADFLESFLALEQGEEFGEALLTIAEHGQLNREHLLFNQLKDIRQASAEIGRLMRAIDSDMGQGMERAIMARTTELLVLEEYFVKGTTESVHLLDGTEYQPQPQDIAEALQILHYGLDAFRVVLGGAKLEIQNDEHGLTTLRCPAMPDVLVQVREEPVANGRHDAQREFDGEARFNVLVSLDNLFGMDPDYDGEALPDGRRNARPIVDDLGDTSRQRALSIRIDREGLLLDREGNVVLRDSTMEQGAATLDLGAGIGDPDNFNVMLGRALAAGNILLAKRRSVRPDYHHVRGVFPVKLGQKGRFAEAMRSVKKHLLGDFDSSSTSSTEKLVA